MKLNQEEIDALKAYFDETNINITSLIKKIGLKKVKVFESIIHKVYK
jgi:tRNA A37 threonylcarbamoyladenosine dehydratase